MEQALVAAKTKDFSFGARATIAEAEAALNEWTRLSNGAALNAVVKLAAHRGTEILSDVWTAIAIGTMSRFSDTGATVVTWGMREVPPDFRRTAFATSLPGLVATQMAGSVVTESQHEVDRDSVERLISLRQKGVLELEGGTSRTLVEFDPTQPRALILQDDAADPAGSKGILFRHLVLRFRSELELGRQNRGRNALVLDEGAYKNLTTFLSELHENGYEHGRTSRAGKSRTGLRILRLRKHIGNNRADLIRRAGSYELLREYLDTVLVGSGQQGVMEASISDFGLGIVDHFLSSAAGKPFRGVHRRTLLDKLLLDTLSAKADDFSAGRGLLHALSASKQMSAFVSLRTGEFWAAQSYAKPDAPLSLRDVSDRNVGYVSGTHWQFFWPQLI